jgi:hypothetical protein
VADQEHGQEFLETCLRTLFTWLPQIKYIAYLLTDSLILFPPLSLSKRKTEGSTDEAKEDQEQDEKAEKYFNEASAVNPNLTFTLHICSQSSFLPSFKIRKSRVEDCDDVTPMLQRQNLLSNGKNEMEHFLAELLESDSDTTKTLVAEVENTVVGFMTLGLNVNQSRLCDTFDLEPFGNLQKDSTSFASNSPKAFKNTFCINLFCMEEKYAQRAHEMVKAAFQILPTYEFCILTTPPLASEHPLWRHFTQIKPKQGKLASHVLYLTCRYSESLTVKKAGDKDFMEIKSLLDAMTVPTSTQQLFSASTSPSSNHKSYIIHQGLQPVGTLLLEKCTAPRDLLDQFDIHEFIGLQIDGLSNKFVVLKEWNVHPFFGNQTRWILEVSYFFFKKNGKFGERAKECDGRKL